MTFPRKLWAHFISFTSWLFQNARPQYHDALMVLYRASWYIVAFSILSLLLNLFGLNYQIDYELVGTLVGSLGVGGLVAGHVRVLCRLSERLQNWLVPAIFGGVTGTTFWFLAVLHWGPPRPSEALVPFSVGAIGFMFLGWLLRLEAASKKESN